MNKTSVHPPVKISPVSWFMLVMLGLVWGTSYILIKRGLIVFSPEQVACLRIGITALSFLPFFLWQFRKVDWSKWKQLLTVGFSGSFIPAFLFATAQTEISSSLTGILSSLTPLFTLFIGIAFFRVQSSRTKVIGVLLGLAGAVWLLLIDQGLENITGMQFGSLVLLACAFYAITNNVVKNYLQDFPTLAISSVSYMMVGIPSIVYLFFSGFADLMQTHDYAWQALGYIAILAVAGTTVASLLFFKLIKNTNALFASTVSYLIPMVAILWGIFDGESINALHFVGMLAILAGVYVARK